MRKVALVCSLCLALVACGGGTKKPQASKSPPPPPRSSLTGLVVADAKVLKRPVIAVKVENSIDARPQSGLDDADVVYEEIAEGGITRFIALYQSQDAPVIGPVRSARLVDPNVLKQFRAILAFSGAHPIVQDALARSGIKLLSYLDYPEAYYRSSARQAPHNLFTSLKRLYKFAKGALPPTNIFRFAEQPPVLPSPSASPSPALARGSHVQINFSEQQTSLWRYSAAKDVYLRWQGSSRHLLTGGSQVSARNVLLLYVKVKMTNILDPAGNPSPDVEVIGSGRLALFRNGIEVKGTWKRAAVDDQTTMTDVTGAPVSLAPGITWIELVPTDVVVTSG